MKRNSSKFSGTIIIFDTYDLFLKKVQLLPQQVITSIERENSIIDFLEEHNIWSFNNFMLREIVSFPVIRIFGSTLLGQKCCINIHDYFPYFYIEITKDNYFDYKSIEKLREFAFLLEDAFLKYTSKKNKFFDPDRSNQIIHRITPDEKRSIYGYYKNLSNFLRVECYNPKDIKPLMNMLHSGVINGKHYQCFEGHISYLIHFFSDYKLFGMGFLNLKSFSFRYPLPKKGNVNFSTQFTCFVNNIVWDNDYSTENTGFIDNDDEMFSVWDNTLSDITYNTFKKGSSCDIELDALCEDIIITDDNYKKTTITDTIEEGFEVDVENLRNYIYNTPSLIDLWKDEIERRKNDKKPPLKFENISYQKNFELVQNFILKNPEKAEEILKKNFLIGTPFPKMDVEEVFFIDEMRLDNLDKNMKEFKKKDRYMIQWYKKRYLISLYAKEENEEEDESMSCFAPITSINERTYTLDSRKKMLNLYQTKTIEECCTVAEDNKNDIGQNYMLLASRNKSQKQFKSLGKYKYYFLYKSLSFYLPNNPMPLYITIDKKLLEGNFYYNTYTNKNLNNLFYSNEVDFALFYRPAKKVNFLRFKQDDSGAYKNNSLKMFVFQHNKITKDPSKITPSSIELRKKRIQRNINISRLRFEEYDRIDCDSQLFYLPHLKLEFLWKAHQKVYGDVKEKIDEKKQLIAKKKNFNQAFYKRYYGKDDVTSSQFEDVNFNEGDQTLIKQSYNIEISPITEKKYKPVFEIQSLYKQQKRKRLSLSDENKKFIQECFTHSPGVTVLSCEVLTDSPSNYGSSSEKDKILCIFISIHDTHTQTNYSLLSKINGIEFPYNYYNVIITTCPEKSITKRYNSSKFVLGPEYIGYKSDEYDSENLIEVLYEKDEISLLRKFAEIVLEYDPDIIFGFETEKASIGYIVERANYLGYPLSYVISRTNPWSFDFYTQEKIEEKSREKAFEKKEKIPYQKYSDFKYMQMKFGNNVSLRGRIVFNLWRVIKHDVNTNDYSIESVVFEVFKYRMPKFEKKVIMDFYLSKEVKKIVFVLYHEMIKNKFSIKLFEKFEIVQKSSQFIKIFGIDIESSFTRGAQYRVEGVFKKVTNANGFLLLSATTSQLENQTLPLTVPMVMEPPKNIFYNPVIVLDFQSLYPSIISAYNICYSTCLGKLDESEQIQSADLKKLFGVYNYSSNLYEMLKDDFNEWHQKNKCDNFLQFLKKNLFIAPNGMTYVKKNIRQGLLPLIIKELLLTRIMIKKSMKIYPKDSPTYSTLNNRQLGIKLLSNVLYGYTAAGFTGRMPNSDIGDSIVSIGKNTLFSSMKFIESNPNWNAKVIYGDTDSIFVSVKDKSPMEAIKIGKEMAEAVTNRNPYPMKLQFEKVYCPLVFISKKHYTGYKYEDISDVEKGVTNLDTKGIENVRSDNCEAVGKVTEKMIKILFQTKDLSKLKDYLYQTYNKIISGRIVFKDFVFFKRVKLGTYRSESLPPSAQVALELYKKDNRFFPLYGQYFPYVVYNSKEGTKFKLKDSVISPMEFFKNRNMTINSAYYIDNIKTVVNRFLEPIGVKIDEWFEKFKRPISLDYNLYYWSELNHKKKEGNDENNINENQSQNFLKSSYSLAINKKGQNIKNFFKKLDTIQSESLVTINPRVERYRQKINENLGIDGNKEKITKLFNHKKKLILLKKINEINKICRFCTEADKFNIDIEDIPCILYQCKLFYQKRLVINELNEIN